MVMEYKGFSFPTDWKWQIAALALAIACGVPGIRGESLRIASYNVENYLVLPSGNRPPKQAQSRQVVVESLKEAGADVLALQEVGGTNALFDLRMALLASGLDYPHWELITSFDTNIQVAVLSRFPMVRRYPHTNDSFLLMGRRLRVSRGFLEVDIEVSPSYRFTLFTTHLKSRRPVAFADEAEMRFKEAELLRKKIDARLAQAPDTNLIVLGDLNDLKNSRPIRFLMGRGRKGLIDTRPAERQAGDTAHDSDPHQNRAVTWTHYYGLEDTYSRIDYILVSPGMAREWRPEESYVVAVPNWGLGSDHRPIVASFLSKDR